jgi:hypothetical protein
MSQSGSTVNPSSIVTAGSIARAVPTAVPGELDNIMPELIGAARNSMSACKFNLVWTHNGPEIYIDPTSDTTRTTALKASLYQLGIYCKHISSPQAGDQWFIDPKQLYKFAELLKGTDHGELAEKLIRCLDMDFVNKNRAGWLNGESNGVPSRSILVSRDDERERNRAMRLFQRYGFTPRIEEDGPLCYLTIPLVERQSLQGRTIPGIEVWNKFQASAVYEHKHPEALADTTTTKWILDNMNGGVSTPRQGR